jgi:hypothetical protein
MTTPKKAIALGLLAAASLFEAQLVRAQEVDGGVPPSGGWRRLGDNRPQTTAQRGPEPGYPQRDPNGPARDPNGAPPPQSPQGNDPNYVPPPPPPEQLTIDPGTFFTIRLNQVLSSDRNQPGDAFTAQLVKPIVVDGTIVADRGQTVAGRVAEVDKGGRIKGTSRLGIELTELSLVDGQQMTIHSQLISHTAPGAVGRDAAAVGTTTAIGAIIGAAAGWGQGAAIGAGAGAAAGLAGVFMTKGYPTLIYPESVLTFRIEAPITVNTTRAPYAFRPVEPGDYSQPSDQPRPQPSLQTRRPGPPNPYYGPYYAGVYDPFWYGPAYGWGYPRYGYGYGPSVGFGVVIRGGGHGGYRGGHR